jgi:hypothetical protein
MIFKSRNYKTWKFNNYLNLYNFINFLEKSIGSNNGVSSRRRSMIEGIIQQAPIVGSAFGLVKNGLSLLTSNRN